MTDVRRASLITLGAPKADANATKKSRRTFRITVNLPESTEDQCPEFNYKDELVAAKRKHSEKAAAPKETNGGLDPFNDNDDDVKRIAAEMEAKYGLGVTKKQKFRKDDFADIGMGYDESDSFIDNTDGYDEIIPKNVTTLHGGFYINCGALEFKTDEEATSDGASEEDDVPSVKATSRKRVLESSSESEGDEETDKSSKMENSEKKQKLLPNRNSMQRALKKRLFSHDKIKQIRKQRQQDSKAVRDSHKEPRSELCGIPHSDTEMQNGDNVPKDIKKPTIEVNTVKELLIAKKPDNCEDSSSMESTSDGKQNNKSVDNSSDSNDVKNKLVDVVITKLPENLSSDIVELIDRIKRAAASSTEGKVRFFSTHVNTMLLELERKCRCLGKQSRLKVYEHLAPFVKCRKETLTKRAKNLILGDDLKKVKVLAEKLKNSVDRTMPNLLEAYESESQKVLHRKFSKESFCNEDPKLLRLPKRRFPWDDDSKKMLRDLVSLRRKCYVLEGKKKESLDELLTAFLKSEVQILWPEGWMSMAVLLRLCVIGSAKKPDAKVPLNTKDLTITPSSAAFATNTLNALTKEPNALTITPITTTTSPGSKNGTFDVKTETKDETTSASAPLPAMEIIRTTVAVDSAKEEPPSERAPPIETVVIEESPVKKDYGLVPPATIAHQQSVIKHESSTKAETHDNYANHCHVVDLTEQPYLKRKPGPKSKTKYYYEYTDKSKYKDQYQGGAYAHNDKLTAATLPTATIAPAQTQSLPDSVRFAQNSAAVTCDPVALTKDAEKAKYKGSSSEGDDIQTVMERLRVLQKMSSPGKPSEEHKTAASPVSVIAFNKAQPQQQPLDGVTQSAAAAAAASRNSSFQDAFQKRFIHDFNIMKACQTGATSQRNNYNSVPKHNHASTSNILHQAPIDPYSPHGIAKVKSSSSQQPANSKPSS